MLDKTRSFIRSILILANIGIIILYLSVCLVPFINTGKYWFIALPGLAFPLIFFSLLCFTFLWIILRSKWAWLCLFVMLLGLQQILAVFSFQLPKQFRADKQPNTLRVLHWNVEGWDASFKKNPERDNYKPEMFSLIKEENADVLCFEEYADIVNINNPKSNVSLIRKMGYPYYLFAPTESKNSISQQGVIIFSKYPIIHSDTFNYGKNTSAEHLIYADILFEQKTIRIFTTHLQSVRFESSDYESLSRLKHAKDPGYHDSRTIVSKLKNGYEHRFEQALMVKEQINKSPYPVIITGDFNDVPNSNTYFTIRGNLQDAFLKKGFFIGQSFRYISPTLRIDFILPDRKFEVIQFRVIHVPFSDHYPLETDLRYN
ncbi:MAG: endonuclease/exonuclease/phosphatase family protein [Ginsengibacter sp.]